MELKKLTDRELLVMKSIWEIGDGVRLAYIIDQVNRKYNLKWKSQTASTFLNKLVLKGFIEPYRDGQYIHYHILVKEQDYRDFIVRQNLTFWNEGNVAAYVSDLFHARKLTRDDIASLRGKLKELDDNGLDVDID